MVDKNLLPIALDIETSGGNIGKHGIWQIGAIDLNNLEEFFGECRIDEDDEISKEALKIINKTEEDLRDKNKQTQRELLEKFFEWLNKREMKNLLCHLPEFDQGFLEYKGIKYFDKDYFWPNHHRAFDLHTIAQTKFFEKNNCFLIKEDNNSDMSLKNILNFCGIEDKRRFMKDGILQEGTPHNALEDAKLTAECFSRLILGKNLFPEFNKFEIPKELIK